MTSDSLTTGADKEAANRATGGTGGTYRRQLSRDSSGSIGRSSTGNPYSLLMINTVAEALTDHADDGADVKRLKEQVRGVPLALKMQ